MGKSTNEVAIAGVSVTNEIVVQGLTNLIRLAKEEVNASNEFFEANKEFDVDRYNSVSYISKTQIGTFVDHENDKEDIGRELYVIFLTGTKIYTLWLEDDARPLIQTTNKAEAIEYILQGKEADDPKFKDINEDMIKQEYLTDFVLLTAEDIEKLKTGGEIDSIKFKRMRLSITGKIRFDEYTQKLFKGQFVGFKKRTPLSSVITKVTTAQEKNTKGNYTYTNFVFAPVEVL